MDTHFYLLLIFSIIQFGCKVDKSKDEKLKADYINPIIGAATFGATTTNIHGYGKTFPGSATPFGLVQLSSDTRTGGDNWCGYSWTHTRIEGFSFTHMSGVGWNGDLDNFLVMPATGKLHTNKGTDSVPESEGMVPKNRQVQRDAFQKKVAEAAIHNNIKEFKGKHLGFFTNFKTHKNEQVLVRSGISFLSVEGAKLNLATDIPDWNFDGVVKNAKALWNKALSTVTVEGATERDKEIFYTALYHTMIDPRSFSDVDGNYIGSDKKVHKTINFTYRTIFSGWDVFQSQFPLQTIINPTMVNDEINSLIQIAELSGKKYFSRWGMLNSYSECMIGNPAVSVVVDAYEKGIRNFDIEKAYTFCKNTVDSFGCGELGYIPFNTGGSSTIFGAASISETLEY